MTASKSSLRRRKAHSRKRGAPPGAAIYTGDVDDTPVIVEVFDYSAEELRERHEMGTTELESLRHTNTVTWINLDGVHEVEQVQAVCKAFGVHALWMEDILNPQGRPKAETIGDAVFVVARMVHVPDGQRGLETEQISLVMGPGYVLTFQERNGDVWTALRARIRNGNGRVRRMKSDYLMHALLDSVVDHYFIAIEELETRVDAFESQALNAESKLDLVAIYALKSELSEFRRAVWAQREAMSVILRTEGEAVSKEVVPYFRDLYDHVVQVMDILETSRERVVGVVELHLAVTSYRLNDIMKVLTIVSTIFIPMTFVAGVYGMNFTHMPELQWTYGYAMAWAVMLSCAVGGGIWVLSRRWL